MSERNLAESGSCGASNVYRTLNADTQEIRILIVEPGQIGPIHCHLVYASLKSDPLPQYETVSYVWGDASIRIAIYLAGRKINVTASSEAALRRMRRESTSRALWIDAICINQDDPAERGQQVAIMYKIFASGACNLIWLGEDEDGMTERALVSMQSVMEEIQVETGDFVDLTEMLYTEFGGFLYSDAGLSASVDADAITSFFRSPWFTRLWVGFPADGMRHQLSHKAQKDCRLFKRQHSLAAAYALEAASKYLSNKSFTDEHIGLINSAYIAELADSRCGIDALNLRWNFLSLLTGMRSLLATQPEDHVFSLLGLYQKLTRTTSLPESLTPKYEGRVSDVFVSASTFSIAERKDLNLLEQVFRRADDNSQSEGLPTWVPQWNRPFDPSHDAYDLSGALFNASKDEIMHQFPSDSADTRVLPVRGISIGIITVSNKVDVNQNPIHFIRQIEAWFEQSRSLYRNSLEDSSQLTAAISTALVGAKNWNYSPIKPTEGVAGYAAYKDALESGKRVLKLRECDDSTPEEVRSESRYIQAFWNLVGNRKAFQLSSGHVGFGPQIAEVGDVAVIAYGSRVPILLRPVGESEGREFELIGPCYVHGVMQGEAVREHRDRRGEDEIFRLV